MKLKFLAGLSLLAFALSGCGGGSSSSSTPSSPTPTPTPNPTPTPTPNPTPTSAVAFHASMGGPLIGSAIFDSNGSGVIGDGTDIATTTNRSGDFGRDAVSRLSAAIPPATATSPAKVGGVSALTGFIYSDIRAPLEASVFSPATSLLGSISEDFIPRNAGLTISAQELANFDTYAALGSSDPEMQTKAKKITALNLKLLAHAGYETTDKGSPTDAIVVATHLESVRAQLLIGSVDFNSSTSLNGVLNQSPRGTFTSAEGKRAASQLLARYGEAVDRYLTNARSIADIEYGLRLVVLPELDALFRTSGSDSAVTDRIFAITTDDLVASFSGFSNIPAVNIATAPFIAVVDWRNMHLGGPSTAFYPADCSNSESLICNDVNIDTGVGSDGTARVIAVRVPSQFAAQLIVTLASDGKVTVQKSGTRRTLVFFEYDSRNAAGSISTSRAYVLINSDI